MRLDIADPDTPALAALIEVDATAILQCQLPPDTDWQSHPTFDERRVERLGVETAVAGIVMERQVRCVIASRWV